MTQLRVSEIFFSIQGESTHVGKPCAFIRLAGCNLSCSYCDTAYAAKSKGEPMTIDNIMARLEGYECRLVEVTGGEPLLQPAAGELLIKLSDAGYETLVETNGTVDITGFDRRTRFIVDVKTPGSGMGQTFLESNYTALTERDEVKFVITSHDDFLWAADICRKRGIIGRTTALFSPAWGIVDPKDLARWILESRINIRLNVQLHKFIWGGEATGV